MRRKGYNALLYTEKNPPVVRLAAILLVCSCASNLCAASVSEVIRTPPVIDRQDIRFTRLSIAGEPFRTWITSFAQDNYGRIWLGTDDGLYCYDGYKLESYRHDPGDPHSLGENTIKALYKDRAGILWIATAYGGLNRFDPARGAFAQYRHDPKDSGSLGDNLVHAIYQDRSGRLWVADNTGLDRLDASGRFLHYPFADPARTAPVTRIYEDRQGRLWIGAANGLYVVDESSHRIALFRYGSTGAEQANQGFVNGILEDRSGVLWVAFAFESGLSALNSKTGEFTRYAFGPRDPAGGRTFGVGGILEDRDGSLWLATSHDGLLRFDPERKYFTRYSIESDASLAFNALFQDLEGNTWAASNNGLWRFRTGPAPFVNYTHEPRNPDSLRNDSVLALHADRDGSLWIGTRAGLDRLNRKTGKVISYQHDHEDPASLSFNEVTAIVEDGARGLWIGTHGGGLNRFDRASGKFTVYRHRPDDPQSLPDDLVQCLSLDRQGFLWVGFHGSGFGRFDPRTGNYKSYLPHPKGLQGPPNENVREIFMDQSGILWLGTNGGLYRFDPRTERLTAYVNNPLDPASLSHDSIGSIYEDRQGSLWIGTRSGLDRLDRNRGTFQVFTSKDGLASDAIEAIREDSRGHLWLATHQGLSEFIPQTKTAVNYFPTDGLPGDFVNPSGVDRSCATADGELVFGSQYGLTVFDPARLGPNAYIPPVVLTDFLLFGKPASHSDSPLHQPIWAARSLRLKSEQSIFTLEFSALSYVAPERNRYRYRLEGLEKDWNEVDGSSRAVTYTSLPAGSYTFRVQGSNNSGIWNEAGARLDITVLPPWWATWWFTTIVAFGVLATAFHAWESRVRGLRLAAARLELQVGERTAELKIAKDAAEEASRAKSVFLAHISHELRNPLSSILAAADMLREDRISEQQQSYVDMIDRSGEHLLTVINDVLDMAKIEAGKQEVTAVPFDAVALARDVTEMLRLKAEAKNLLLVCDTAPDMQRFLRADAAKLRHVLINLLGNAIKFTDRGRVVLRLNANPATDSGRLQLRLEVEDTGIGIAPADHARIFEAFVQAGTLGRKGTGLGLAITRQFVEIMGGAITVESAPGRGSLFTVEVPVEAAVAGETPGARPFEPTGFVLAPNQPECRVLVVEDDPEIGVIMEQMLCRVGFQVRAAQDGAAAIEVFSHWRPHFIWMDLQLPGISGTEAARRIRKIQGGGAVKIAAMTASAFASDREQILAAGLDDFVLKPCRPSDVYAVLARHLQLALASEAQNANG